MEVSRLTPDGTAETDPSRETKFSGTNADREIFVFLVQLTTGRIGSLAGLIHTLATVQYSSTSTVVVALVRTTK